MPHLSPLNWVVLFLLISSFLVICSACLWWAQKNSYTLEPNCLTKPARAWSW